MTKLALATGGQTGLSFVSTAAAVQVIPGSLRELPLLRGFDDQELLNNLAGRFTQREVAAGEVVVEPGRPAEQLFLIAHGKADKLAPGKYGEPAALAVLADGDHFGTHTLLAPEAQWEFTVKALTPLTLLVLSRAQFQESIRFRGVNPKSPFRINVGFTLVVGESSGKRAAFVDFIWPTVGSEVARLRAGHRPPLKLHVRFSRMQLSRRHWWQRRKGLTIEWSPSPFWSGRFRMPVS